MSNQLKKATAGFGFIGSVLVFLLFALVVVIFWPRNKEGQTLDDKRGAAREVRLELLNKENHGKLSGYAWVNKDKGVVQIPIEHAMELEATELANKPVKASAVKVENPYPYGLQQVAAPAAPVAPAANAVSPAAPGASPAPAASPAAGGAAAPAPAAPAATTTAPAAPAAPAPAK